MLPCIGIVSNFDRERDLYRCAPAYIQAVVVAGGMPILLPYLTSAAQIDRLFELIDGFILSGGADLDPRLYGQPMHPAVEDVVQDRDTFEMSLVRAALDRDVPLLAICRGAQSLNIAAGGSLHVDIPVCVPGAFDHRDGRSLNVMAHEVLVAPGTKLEQICDATTIEVNSQHHQAVDRVGQGLRISAHAPDGVVEAIESPAHRFVIGVQWHPERIWQSVPACRRLLEGLVRACMEPRAPGLAR